MFSMSACSNEEELQADVSTEEVNKITITATDFEYPTTRTDFEIGSSGAAFKWAKNDTVGIFPNEGAQVYFPMISGAGTNSASFTGGGWALKSSATYAAYYPFIGDMYLNQKKIPISYTGQVQTGNGSTAHLGAYDFMAASATTAENGGVNFNFKHLGCLVQLKITVPNAGTLASVTLTADEEVFVEKGHIDLTSVTPAVVPTQTTNCLNIVVKDVATTATNEIVTVYFMIAPVDMTGKTLTIKSGDIERTVEAKNFEGGKAYQLATSLKNSGPIAVDLGLSVKWASCNVGAESPEEYGDYFAWGETEEKSDYDWETYKWWSDANGDGQSEENEMIDIGNNISGTKYDVAHVKWGGGWRMPTKNEIQELVDKCSWKMTIYSEVNGYLVTGPNGNSIFLPAAGDNKSYNGHSGYYWASTVGDNEALHGGSCCAYCFSFWSSGYEDGYCSRSDAHSVRPVSD